MGWIWLHFGTFLEPYFDVFFCVACIFAGLFCIWAPKSDPRAPKMVPKWSPNRVRGHPVDGEKTMVFTVREAYEEVSGTLWENTFSRRRLQTLLGGVSGSIVADFRRF